MTKVAPATTMLPCEIPGLGKRNHMRTWLAALAAALYAATLNMAPARAADPIVIKFSHVSAPQSHKARAVEHLKVLAERYTDGRVQMEIYPNSQLYKDKEELEALQLGAVQMLAPSLSKLRPLGVRAFEVFDVPYLFPDAEAIRKVADGPMGKELLALLEPKGLKGLAFWDNGFKILSANHPLIIPDDALGLKMRIQASRAIETQMGAIGALPQVTAFSEAYQSLSSGVVDGTENTPANMYTQKMHLVQEHATLTNHGYLGYVILTNKKFWDGLPPDVRAGLERAIAETTPIEREMARKENKESLEAMQALGTTDFHVPTASERQAWIGAFAAVEPEVASRVGGELIRRIKNLLKQKP
jgi:C4-dicarboxylate-binding protein DctP